MLRKAMKPIPRSFWVALSAIVLLVIVGAGYNYNFNNNRQSCVQEISTEVLTCHHPNPGERAGTIFVITRRS